MVKYELISYINNEKFFHLVIIRSMSYKGKVYEFLENVERIIIGT